MIGFPSSVALDPGTANTLLYVKGRGVAISEPSLVTIRTSTREIVTVGEEAEAGLGRTPRKFQTARPIRGGAISDLDLFDGMLHRFLRKAHISGLLRRLQAAIAIPSSMTEVERLALVESIRKAGSIGVLLVEQVLAAARGAGLAIEESRGRMVVNIGAGVTDVAIISLGNTVCAGSTHVAGDEMDAAIVSHVRAVHQLLIGEPTAQRLKIMIGSATPRHAELSLRVKGRCAERGVPREAVIRGSEIREALSAPLARIVHTIREVLEQAPPELSADLVDTGIVLTGGSALLRGLDRLITLDCGLPVRAASEPMSCVILGLAYQLDHLCLADWRRFNAAC
ncbi:MAG: rod shape-determining protein [Bryobacterales bacterium]|nr:rod shape-determining protein [Bryobacterales bacterium]